MSILEHARDIAQLIKKYNDHELYEKIVSLREEILQLRDENIRLVDELRGFKRVAVLENELIRDGNCLYKRSDAEKQHPYCLACWGYDQKLVGLILSTNLHSGSRTILCKICEGRRRANKQ